jgi:hypothetical protein
MEVLLFVLGIAFSFLLFRLYLDIKRGVEITRIFYDGNSATAKFVFESFVARTFLPKRYIAISIWKYVFVKTPTLPNNIIIHELRHTLQWMEHGFFGFLRNYLKEHREHGYTCNKFEVDARIAAGEPTRCE